MSHHEIPKSKIGERERQRQRNLRSKNDNVLSREREYLWHSELQLLKSENLREGGLRLLESE